MVWCKLLWKLTSKTLPQHEKDLMTWSNVTCHLGRMQTSTISTRPTNFPTQQPVASMRTFRRALQDGPSKNESMSCQLSCHVMSNFMSCHVKFHVMSCQISCHVMSCQQCQDWKKVLKFRPQTTHSECHHCHELKKAIRDAVDLKAHLVAADQLLRHLSGQWADRKVYWTSRSRAKTSRDLLVMMCDGMDKGKYHLPRWSGGRAPKQAESLSRPACEVYACLLHGHMLCVYISDCDQTSGSNLWSRWFPEHWTKPSRNRRRPLLAGPRHSKCGVTIHQRQAYMSVSCDMFHDSCLMSHDSLTCLHVSCQHFMSHVFRKSKMGSSVASPVRW